MIVLKQTLKILTLLVNIGLLIFLFWLNYYLYNNHYEGIGAITTIFTIIIIYANICIISKIDNNFLLSPFLGKPIYHKCGIFFAEIKNGEYFLYNDKIFYKEELLSIDIDRIFSEKELLNKFSEKIDYIFQKELEKKEKKDFLYKSDGYVDPALRREKRINKIL
jgi:hypothetical protein